MGFFKPVFGGASARRTVGTAIGAVTAFAVGVGALGAGAPAAAQHKLANPYEDAQVYVNPEWSQYALSEPGGAAVASQPTAVWLERITWIDDPAGEAGRSMGLRDHLDEALVQGADVVQLVLHNLPGRSCGRPAWYGELGPDELNRYRKDYIDPIVEILGDELYADLRIVVLVEPDSLSSLIRNTGVHEGATALCEQMLENGGYIEGIGYAVAELSKLPNVYPYLDGGHHGVLGWPLDFWPWVKLVTEAGFAGGSLQNVHGFMINVSAYGALHEPYFSRDDFVNGQPVYASRWVDWNYYLDELSYTKAVRDAMTYMGFSPHISMVIDTSRNGWGGPDRPTGPGPKTTLDAYVDGSRIDRRLDVEHWCNQSGAGLGERPVAHPEEGVDAYAWIKPPGESDGTGEEIINVEGRMSDPWCAPLHWSEGPTGALPDAPLWGRWHSEQFRQLVANAYPPVESG